MPKKLTFVFVSFSLLCFMMAYAQKDKPPTWNDLYMPHIVETDLYVEDAAWRPVGKIQSFTAVPFVAGNLIVAFGLPDARFVHLEVSRDYIDVVNAGVTYYRVDDCLDEPFINDFAPDLLLPRTYYIFPGRSLGLPDRDFPDRGIFAESFWNGETCIDMTTTRIAEAVPAIDTGIDIDAIWIPPFFVVAEEEQSKYNKELGEIECDDGLDNDEDRLIDCDDPDCARLCGN